MKYYFENDLLRDSTSSDLGSENAKACLFYFLEFNDLNFLVLDARDRSESLFVEKMQ